jgi:hypothetical protein
VLDLCFNQASPFLKDGPILRLFLVPTLTKEELQRLDAHLVQLVGSHVYFDDLVCDKRQGDIRQGMAWQGKARQNKNKTRRDKTTKHNTTQTRVHDFCRVHVFAFQVHLRKRIASTIFESMRSIPWS